MMCSVDRRWAVSVYSGTRSRPYASRQKSCISRPCTAAKSSGRLAGRARKAASWGPAAVSGPGSV